jgi:hypothetical protein
MGHARKRSWRNLLIDREYQLLFTLFMVVTCALFMAGLGYLVLKEADTATKTAIQDVQGQPHLDEAVIRQTIEKLEARRDLLVAILAVLGVGLTGGLFVYGIKMTHRVAGPLYKVGLYCEAVGAGRYDRIVPLRKGDQLVAFYEHFKEAHEALRRRNDRDIECLRSVIAAAEQADVAGRSEELGDRLEDLRAVLARKEASRG